MQDIIQPNQIHHHSKKKTLTLVVFTFAVLILIVVALYTQKQNTSSPAQDLQGLTEVSTPKTTTSQEQYNELMMLQDSSENSNQ
jgi:uncharacterized protein YpmS